MKFLQQSIEKKLSSLLGSEVRFGSMKISPLQGRVEAEGMIISGGEAGRPLLVIRRIDARISVGKALKGQIEVKSLLVEGPEIFIHRHSDGSFNLPKIAAATAGQESGRDWQFDAQSIRVVGGKFSYEHEGYRSSAEPIGGELKCHRGVIEVALRIGSLARRDVPVDFGEIELSGQMDDQSGLSGVGVAPFHGDWRFADGLRLSVDSPGFSSGRAAIELHGPLDVKRWQAAVPGNFLPPALAALNFSGPVDADVRLDVSFSEGIHVREMHLRAANDDAMDTVEPPRRQDAM